MKREPSVSILIAALLGACSTDVYLGGLDDGGAGDAGSSPDSAVDASFDSAVDAAPMLTPFPDGNYDLAISATITESMCAGPSLMGMESAFAGITRDSLGLAGGPVVVRGIDAIHLDVSGSPIETGFMQPSVRLEKAGGPGVPPEIWVGVGTRADAGPLDTALVAILLEADETTVTASGFDGRVSALYIDPLVEDSQCVVAFDAHFGLR
jgi:hypothetical protein